MMNVEIDFLVQIYYFADEEELQKISAHAWK